MVTHKSILNITTFKAQGIMQIKHKQFAVGFMICNKLYNLDFYDLHSIEFEPTFSLRGIE